MVKERTEYHQTIRTHLSQAYLLPEHRIDSLLPRFLESLETLMRNLELIAGTEKTVELSRAGHAIKGALLNLGLMDLAELAYTIEQKSKFGEIQWDRAHYVAELKREIAKII